MTTQIIRDTEGVIISGKFCLFGGSSKEKAISCVGAREYVEFFFETSLASSDTLFYEVLNSITVTENGVTKNLVDFEDLSVEYITDVTYPTSQGFVHLNTTLIELFNNTDITRTLKLKIDNEFKGFVMFANPEDQVNKSIVNKGMEMSFCLAPQLN